MHKADDTRRQGSQFKLLRHFTWASIAIIVVLSFFATIIATQVIQRTNIEIEKDVADSLSEEILFHLKTRGYSPSNWIGISESELRDPGLAQKFENYNVIEFSLLSMNGSVIATASDDAVRQHVVWQYGFHLAKSGQVASHWEAERWMPFLFPRNKMEGWIETYVPVREGTSVNAVIRVRRDLGRLIAEEYQVVPKVIAVGIGGALVAFSAIWMVVLRADRIINRQHAQIEESNNRLQDLDRRKDEFLAICSHDIRSPLTGVYAGGQLLLKEKIGPLNETQRGIIERNRIAVKTIMDLTSELLDLARIDAGQEALNLERFDLSDVIDESIAAHHSQAEARNITLEIQRPDAKCKIEADRLKILRVCNNLISNAIKHAPQKSAVTVTVCAGPEQARFTVADRGPGIDAEGIKLLFDRFTSLSSSKKTREEGTGLGLSIVRGLIVLHGGTIEVASAIGTGTSFTVTLPAQG